MGILCPLYISTCWVGLGINNIHSIQNEHKNISNSIISIQKQIFNVIFCVERTPYSTPAYGMCALWSPISKLIQKLVLRCVVCGGYCCAKGVQHTIGKSGGGLVIHKYHKTHYKTMIITKTLQELRMLSRSLSDIVNCVTKSQNRSQSESYFIVVINHWSPCSHEIKTSLTHLLN